MRTTPPLVRGPAVLALALALPAALAACGGATEEPEVLLDLHWSLSRAGQLVTCADVDAVSVDWLLDGEDDRELAFTFDCVDQLSSQALVPEQPYRLSAKLRRNDGVVIAQCTSSYDPADVVGVELCSFEVP